MKYYIDKKEVTKEEAQKQIEINNEIMKNVFNGDNFSLMLQCKFVVLSQKEFELVRLTRPK